MDLSTLKQQFLEYLEIEQGRSAKTIENYDRYLSRFFSFTKIKQPLAITERRVAEFRQYLNREPGLKLGNRTAPMKQRTQNYYLTALRVFLKYLQKRGFAVIAPECIELVKVLERSPDLISMDELTRLLATPPRNTLIGKRDRAILELLCSTGLRVSELCALAIAEVDFSQAEFSVRGKGGKERVVFLTDAAKGALGEYLSARQDGETALFIRYGRKAHLGTTARVTPRTVERLLNGYATKAGITRKVTPQIIRHSFAANLVRNGADLQSIQALLGHAHIGTTQVYIHLTDKSLSTVHKQVHSPGQ